MQRLMGPGRATGAESGAEEDEASNQYLTFRLEDETYAFRITGVKEILEFGGLTQLPLQPDVVAGVMNLRGRVVPVIDLARRLGRPGRPPGRRSSVIVAEIAAEDETRDVGVLVDAVSEVIGIAPSELRPVPDFGVRVARDLVEHMACVDDDFVPVLNAALVAGWEASVGLAPEAA